MDARSPRFDRSGGLQRGFAISIAPMSGPAVSLSPDGECLSDAEAPTADGPTPLQLGALRAAQAHEAGQTWDIERVNGLDCIDRDWLTEDYYLTVLGKKVLQQFDA